jgi:hypothetical protein
LDTWNYTYDPRAMRAGSTTVNVGSQVVERNSYDGYDRLIRQQKWDPAGVHQSTKSVNFDPFDRTASQSVTVTTQQQAGGVIRVHADFPR